VVVGTVVHAQPPPSIEVRSTGSATHFLVVPSHSGAVAGQLVSSMHSTHCFVFASQIGTEPGHSELFVQSFPHLWVVVLQIGCAGSQSLLPTQSTHFFVCGSQTGAEPGHSELFEQSVPHVCVFVLQMGVGSLQFVLSTHSSHCFVCGSQTGFEPGHSELAVQVATHVFVIGSQTGADAGQSAPVTHATHLLLATSQTGVAPMHAVLFVAVHWTQKLSGVLQAGAADVQFASVVQPSVHWWIAVLHTPFGPVHSAFVLHWTHRFAVTSQTGVPPVHAAMLVAEHWVHLPAFAPVLMHAGAAAVVHAAGVPAPRSPSHGMQVPAALQIGVAPEHWSLESHCTHVWLVSLHAGFAPTQSTLSVFVHSTHLPVSTPPLTHAGLVASVHAFGVPAAGGMGLSPSHPSHVPPEQIGVVPAHAVSVRQATHVFDVVLQVGVGAAH
jgi:hypothetical protein